MALNAFLALYDATGDQKWLSAAKQAADFSETWVFAWSYEVDTKCKAYAADGPLGLSLIATGHSGMDNWLVYQGANFYRLYVYTDDEHYRDVAVFLLNTGHRTTEHDGNKLGYDKDGLVEEAISLVDLICEGTNVWLPWSSVARIEPLIQLENVFGSMDLEEIEGFPMEERIRLNESARNRINGDH